jgi:hypothetical protein
MQDLDFSDEETAALIKELHDIVEVNGISGFASSDDCQK